MDPLPDLPPKQNVSSCFKYQSISDPVSLPRSAISGRYTEKLLAFLAAVHFLLCVAMLRGLMLSGFWLRCLVFILLIQAKHVAAVRSGDGGDSTIQTAGIWYRVYGTATHPGLSIKVPMSETGQNRDSQGREYSCW